MSARRCSEQSHDRQKNPTSAALTARAAGLRQRSKQNNFHRSCHFTLRLGSLGALADIFSFILHFLPFFHRSWPTVWEPLPSSLREAWILGKINKVATLGLCSRSIMCSNAVQPSLLFAKRRKSKASLFSSSRSPPPLLIPTTPASPAPYASRILSSGTGPTKMGTTSFRWTRWPLLSGS